MIDGDCACAGPAEAVLFENGDWRVLGDGLEHRGTGYFIPREDIGRRRGGDAWEWPLHISEKSWCTPRLFHEAFLAALPVFGIEPDEGLGRSFAQGFGLQAGRNAAAGKDGFVAIGDLVRPGPTSRKRPSVAETRAVPLRGPAATPAFAHRAGGGGGARQHAVP